MDFDFDFRIPIDIMNFQDDTDFGMDHQMGQQDLVKKKSFSIYFKSYLSYIVSFFV